MLKLLSIIFIITLYYTFLSLNNQNIIPLPNQLYSHSLNKVIIKSNLNIVDNNMSSLFIHVNHNNHNNHNELEGNDKDENKHKKQQRHLSRLKKLFYTWRSLYLVYKYSKVKPPYHIYILS